MFYVLELLDIEAEDRFGSDSSESGENAKLETKCLSLLPLSVIIPDIFI